VPVSCKGTPSRSPSTTPTHPPRPETRAARSTCRLDQHRHCGCLLKARAGRLAYDTGRHRHGDVFGERALVRAEDAVTDVELRDGGADRWTGVSEKRSTGLIEAARTRTRTPSSGTTGVSISATFKRSAGPGLSLRTAFISTQFKLNGGYWSVMSVKA
jgi:hypothetical protein